MKLFYIGSQIANNYLKNLVIDPKRPSKNSQTFESKIHTLPHLQDFISQIFEIQEQNPQTQPYEIDSFWKKFRLQLMGISQIYILTESPYRQTLQYHDLPEETDILEIQKNMQIAEQINRVLHSKLQITSPNFPTRKTDLWRDSKDIEGLITPSKLTDLKHTLGSIRMLKDTNKILTEAVRKKIGNCGELAFLGYHTIRSTYPQMPVKCVSIDKGDHCFVIIGSNNNRVVLDIWANAFFVLNEKKWFSSYVGMEIDKTSCKTIVEKIPANSKLNTIFSSEDSDKLHFPEDFSLKEDCEIESALVQKFNF